MQEPHDVRSNPILDRQNLDTHGANQTVTYPIYSQEPTSTDWATKRLLKACYPPLRPELSNYRAIDGALHRDINRLYYFPVMPCAFDANWGQWDIQYYLHKKWMPREYIRRWDPNGQPDSSGCGI
jgi:hypothetical protein